jgi:hydrogenase nickel incorporation protein HypA/HybF
MHEASLAQSIIEIVRRYVPPEDGKAVRNVRVRIGELAGVVAESLEFCYDALAPGHGLALSRLSIERVPATARCARCENVFAIDFTAFRCPSCNGTAVDVLSGRELQVLDIEVED